MTGSNKAIDELRHEYKEKQAELKKYDSFLDRHQALVVFAPLLLVLIGVLTIVGLNESAAPGRSSDSLAIKIVGITSLVVLIGAVVMAFITGSRKSAKAKIDKQLASLKKDVALLHEHGKNHDNITRDELGLWRDIEKNSKADSNKGGWVMGLIVIVVVAAVISMSQASQRNQEAAERARQAEIVEQQRAKQQQDALEQQKIDQQNEANRLQQQQNAIDMYNATKPSNNSNYRSGTSCTSRAIGSTVYTDCD